MAQSFYAPGINLHLEGYWIAGKNYRSVNWWTSVIFKGIVQIKRKSNTHAMQTLYSLNGLLLKGGAEQVHDISGMEQLKHWWQHQTNTEVCTYLSILEHRPHYFTLPWLALHCLEVKSSKEQDHGIEVHIVVVVVVAGSNLNWFSRMQADT